MALPSLSPAFVAAHPVQTVAAGDDASAGGGDYAREESDAIEQRLKGLGYIE